MGGVNRVKNFAVMSTLADLWRGRCCATPQALAVFLFVPAGVGLSIGSIALLLLPAALVAVIVQAALGRRWP